MSPKQAAARRRRAAWKKLDRIIRGLEMSTGHEPKPRNGNRKSWRRKFVPAAAAFHRAHLINH